MAVEGCYACMKYLLYFFNALLFIVGGAIVVVGIVLKLTVGDIAAMIEQTKLDDFFNISQTTSIAPYIFIGVGCFLILIGIIGCCGACREVSWLLGVFFACLALIFVLCVWAGVHTLVLTFQLKAEGDQYLERIVTKVDQERASENERQYLDTIQRTLKCCGAFQGSEDYKDGNIPDSCAPENYDQPCTDKTNYVIFVMMVAGGSILGVACFMLMGMLLSLALCCAVRKISGSNIA